MAIINWIKIKVLDSALNSMSEDKIADMIEDFGKKEFGEQVDKYLDGIQRKMARVIVALNKRRKV